MNATGATEGLCRQVQEPPRGAIPGCGVVVFENRHNPGRSSEMDDPCPRFYFVISGQAQWEVGGRRFLLGPDTFCHIPAGRNYYEEIRANEPVLAYVLRYRSELLGPALSTQLAGLGLLPLDLTTLNLSHTRVVKSIFQEMLFEQEARQEGWEGLLQSRLMDLAVRTLRLVHRRAQVDLPVFEPGNDSADRVARYALRLKSQFFRRESMDEAARSVGLSRRHFTLLFRKVTGQSWRQYVLGLRLKHAGKLLREGDTSVLAVAFESGFEDLSHFYHSFKATYSCSPLEYREQHRVRLPEHLHPLLEPADNGPGSGGFRFRGMKGWFWTTEQYLEEIQVLSNLRMNFLMSCCGSVIVSRAEGLCTTDWWKPMTEGTKEAYSRIIKACAKHGITFCFSLYPQLAPARPFDAGSAEDVAVFYEHFGWAQSQHVQWFSLCFGAAGWGSSGPTAGGAIHAALVNQVFQRLRTVDDGAQLIFYPAASWGDGSNPEHRAYLEALAQQMDPEVYVFWNGDGVVTARMTRVAAESYRSVVKHRLFLWDNYPVNDGNPTLHLGPLRGRAPDLCEVINGYMSNSMCTQSQINRIPLATRADYAYNPRAYDPARSIGQAIVRLGRTHSQQQVLKDLVEAYPGFIVAGGGTGTNPVRVKFGSILNRADSQSASEAFIHQIEDIYARLVKEFPGQFPATRETVMSDIQWMKSERLA